MPKRSSSKKLMFLPPVNAAAARATVIPITSATPTAQWVVVTPDMAVKWLDSDNTNNRKLREDYVQRLASDMLTGKWRGRNGESIGFDTNGRLVDGQHRLWACVQADTPFETLLVTGLDPEDYTTKGIGRPKNFADFLGPVHGEKNVVLLGAAVRLVHIWTHGNLGLTTTKKIIPTIQELEVTYRDHPNLAESVSTVVSMGNLKKFLAPSFACLIHYAATLENKTALVNDFLGRLNDGLGLTEDDPVYQLRKFLLSQKQPQPGRRRAAQAYVLALVIKAWNATKSEQKIQRLQFKTGEEFPTL